MSTQSPNVLKSIESAGQAGAMMSKAGDVVAKGLGAYHEAQVTAKLNKALADYSIGSAKIKSEAKLDENYENSDKYIQDLNKLRDDSLSVFQDNPVLMNRFAPDFDKQIGLDEVSIQHDFRKKELDAGRANLSTGIESSIENAIGGSDSEAWMAEKRIDFLIDSNIKSGLISQDVGEASRLEAKEQIREGRIQKQMWDDPLAFIDTIKENPLVQPEERREYEVAAKRLYNHRESMIDFQKKVDNAEGAIGLGEMLSQGELTPTHVTQMIKENKIDEKVGKAYLGAFYKKIPDEMPMGSHVHYLKLMKTMIDTKNADGVSDVVTEATNMYNSGVMGLDDFTYFLQYARGMLSSAKKREENPEKSKLRWAFDNLTAPGLAVKQFNAIKSFFQKRAKDMPIEDAVKEVQNEAVISIDPTLQTAENPTDAYYEKTATRILQDSGKTVTRRNIDYIKEQLKNAK